MKITTIGIDLAKMVFQVHGVDAHGKTRLRKQLKRKDVVSFFANLEPCLIGMEACGSAHYWARKISELGHTVRLMAPQFVKPYVKTNKSDRNDAEAICEAVARPNMRFVAVKTADMQAVLALHRARQGFVKARTAQANQIRGLLAEFGIVIAKGIGHIAKRLPEILEDGENGLPGMMRSVSSIGIRSGLSKRFAVDERMMRLTPCSTMLRNKFRPLVTLSPRYRNGCCIDSPTSVFEAKCITASGRCCERAASITVRFARSPSTKTASGCTAARWP